MGKHYTVVLLILISLMIPLAFADDFVGYKYPGEKFSLNGDNFSMQLSKDSKLIILNYNNQEMIIVNNSCKETQEKLYFICLKGIVVDFDKDIGKLDPKTGDVIPGLNMTFSYRKQDISVKRSLSKKDPIIMEEVDANITIENNGKNPASIDYIEIMPLGIEVLSTYGLSVENNILRYIGSVNPGSYVILRYKIRPLKMISDYITGNITYTYESLKGVTALEKINLKTSDTVSLKLDYVENMNLDEEGSLSFTLRNNEPKEDAKTSLSLSIPKELSVKYTSDDITKNSDQYYIYESILKANLSKNLRFEFLAAKTGAYTIPLNITYTTYGITIFTSKNISIKVSSGKITPSIVIDDTEIMGNQRIKVKGVIKNNDNLSSYYNIETSVSSDILQKAYSAGQSLPLINLTLFEEQVTLPDINKSTEFTLIFSGKYYSKNNETFNFSTSKTIKVLPPSDFITIYHEIDNYTDTPGITKIAVYVENKRPLALKDAEISEELSQDVTLIEGSTKRNTVIDPKRKSQVYIYTVKYPDDKSAYDVKTALRFKEYDKEVLLTQITRINTTSKVSSSTNISTKVTSQATNASSNKEGSVENKTASQTKQNVNANSQNNNQQALKKSLWQRFLAWLSNL